MSNSYVPPPSQGPAHEQPQQYAAPRQQDQVPGGAYPESGHPQGADQPGTYQSGYQPVAKKERNVVGVIALIVAIVGFVFACIPGALIIGWVLLPIAFVLSIVSLFLRGKGKGLGIAALIVSVVGTVVGVVVFLALLASSFEQALQAETTVAVPAPDDAADTEDAAPAAEPASTEGTRENPLPIPSTVSSDDWTVTVDAYDADGDAVIAATEFNEPAPAGSHYEIATYTVTYTGDESGIAGEVGTDLVLSSGNVVTSYDTLVILDDSIGGEELFSGASATGSVAFLVPDGEDALLRVAPGFFADEVFFQP